MIIANSILFDFKEDYVQEGILIQIKTNSISHRIHHFENACWHSDLGNAKYQILNDGFKTRIKLKQWFVMSTDATVNKVFWLHSVLFMITSTFVLQVQCLEWIVQLSLWLQNHVKCWKHVHKKNNVLVHDFRFVTNTQNNQHITLYRKGFIT